MDNLTFFYYAVLAKPNDVAFIAGVEENWLVAAGPVRVIYDIAHLVCVLFVALVIVEMVKLSSSHGKSNFNLKQILSF